jgi:hypothetical protein
VQKSEANAASSASSNSVLQEMSQLVDAALSQAPASSISPAASEAVALPITTQDPCQTYHHDCDAAAAHHDRSVRESGDGQSSVLKAAEYAAVEDRGNGKGTVDTKGPQQGLSSSQSTKSIGSRKVNRPAWALTADAAQDAEQQEEEDLLAFAGGLEFDKYINEQEDAELRTALQVLLILLLWGSVTLAQAIVDASSQALSPCQQQPLHYSKQPCKCASASQAYKLYT